MHRSQQHGTVAQLLLYCIYAIKFENENPLTFQTGARLTSLVRVGRKVHRIEEKYLINVTVRPGTRRSDGHVTE